MALGGNEMMHVQDGTAHKRSTPRLVADINNFATVAAVQAADLTGVNAISIADYGSFVLDATAGADDGRFTIHDTAGNRFVALDQFYNIRSLDTAAKIAQMATDIQNGRPVRVQTAFDISPSAAEAAAIFENLGNLRAQAGGILQFPDGEHSISSFVDLNANFFSEVTLQAATSHAVVTCSGAVTATGSAKNWSITYNNVSDTSNITVGRFVRISGATGTGDVETCEGGYEVTATTATTVTVKATLDMAAFPAITLTSANIKPINVVFKWPAGTRGLAINTTLREIRDIAFVGSFDYSANAGGDGSEDGLLVGDQANTVDTGVTQSQQTNTGYVWLANVIVANWPNNGVQVKGGKLTTTVGGLVASGCGYRGIQSANNGTVLASGAIVSGCYQGVEAESGGLGRYDDGRFHGNTNQGAYFFAAGRGSVTNAVSRYNGTHGLQAENGSDVQADGLVSESNTNFGVTATASRITCGLGANFSSNGAGDTQCVQNGVVNGQGATSLGTITVGHDSGAQVIDTDGELVHPATINVTEGTGADTFGFSTDGNGHTSMRSNGTNLVRLRTSGIFEPVADNAYNLGRGSNRWGTVFAGTGTINTSDKRKKKDISPINDKVLDAWAEVEWMQYRLIEDDDGLQRAGVIAQHVIAAFERHGLNALEFGVVHHEAWDADEEREAGDWFGVNYNEALALEAALTRRTLRRLGG